MDLPTKIFLGWLITCYVTMPALVLAHELGHAVAILRAGRPVIVIVGCEPPLIRYRADRLDLRFHPLLDRLELHRRIGERGSRSDLWGACRYDSRGLTAGQLRSIMRAGPFANVVTGLMCATVAYLGAGSASFLFWLAASAFIISFWFALGNLAPRARAGLVSDGQRMLSIKGLSADAVPVPLPPAGDIESSGSSVAPPCA